MPFGKDRTSNKEWSLILRLGVPSVGQAPSAQLCQQHQYCDSRTHSESMPWDFVIASPLTSDGERESKNSRPPPLNVSILTATGTRCTGRRFQWPNRFKHISNFGSVMAMKHPDLHNLPWIMRITSSNPRACGFSSDH